jgi:metal-responsive CopG/Arc/MetJ family transcriptional regulator
MREKTFKPLLAKYLRLIMPLYSVTSSFSPEEIKAIDERCEVEGFKSRYQLIREAVITYVGLPDGSEEKEKRRVRSKNRRVVNQINDVDE